MEVSHSDCARIGAFVILAKKKGGLSPLFNPDYAAARCAASLAPIKTMSPNPGAASLESSLIT